MSFQVQPTSAKGPRRTGLLLLGLLVLIGGVGTGIGLFVAAGSQYDDAVVGLQRAPVGCDTELNFTGTGTFYFYVETKGAVGDLRGDCDNTEFDYDLDDEPDVDLTLTDEDGEEVDLDRNAAASYDRAGFTGTSVRTVTIDDPAEYVLSVESGDGEFAIAVGRNPKDDFDSAQTIAIVVAAAGLVLGLLVIILGMRRKPAPVTGALPGAGFGTPGFGTPAPVPPSVPATGPPVFTPAPTAPPGPPTAPQPAFPPQSPLPPVGPAPPAPAGPPPVAPPPAPPTGNPWGAPDQ